MKKAYVIFPLIGLLLFAGLYWNFTSGIADKEHQEKEAKKQAAAAKQQAEFESRKKAIEESNALQEKRKAERLEREAQEAAEKKLLQELSDERDRTRDEKDRVLRQVDRLRGELKVDTEAVARIDADRKFSLEEEVFLQKYIKLAEENQKALQASIVKLENAKIVAARMAAEAAAPKK